MNGHNREVEYHLKMDIAILINLAKPNVVKFIDSLQIHVLVLERSVLKAHLREVTPFKNEKKKFRRTDNEEYIVQTSQCLKMVFKTMSCQVHVHSIRTFSQVIFLFIFPGFNKRVIYRMFILFKQMKY
jgi:hypothetical protein